MHRHILSINDGLALNPSVPYNEADKEGCIPLYDGQNAMYLRLIGFNTVLVVFCNS